ncbi:SDR family oxidoreductase [Maricaulis sp.]|uniref:SDR family oxidoreductase n=1 Tax=Maricaulis sp. TaxID=1486257 RepID=UPI00260ED083|nr:SDR family oxidoreductase [Maricaulis sp.]
MNILLTGASSGFGRMTTHALLDKGHKVAATMRDPGGRNAAVADELRTAGAFVTEIDVTSTESVDTGVAASIEALGSIDAVINNAGVGVHGLQESFTPEDFQRLFDINVFGVQRMNRAVLPHMRQRGSGLLMHISSLLGRFTLPFYGPYNASKHALEGLAENYRSELSGFGIETVLIEPGGFPTEFGANLMHPSDDAAEMGYGPMAQAPQQAAEGFMEFLAANPQQDPKLVIEAIVRVIETPHGQRPFRTPVDELGWRPLFEAYNAEADKLTQAIYGGMGMDGMLAVKVSEDA